MQLTDEQVEIFNSQGFLALNRITADEELSRLRGLYDRVFSDRAGEDSGAYFDLAGPRGHDGREVLPQVLHPEQRYPELLELTYRQNVIKAGARLLGIGESDVNLFGHMILKPAGYGRETPWHQDEAYSPDLEHDRRSISFWMPLDDATVESGCLQFIPGSHSDEVRWHRHIDDDPTVHGLMTDDVDPSEAVAVPIPAGGATVHHTRTVHYAGPNTTDRARRAYILVAAAPVHDKRAVPAQRPWLDEEREALAAKGQSGSR